ncbi:MAG: hypothetical protein ACOVQN_03065 [Exiguobacterium sp.]|jgi:hypothetical protein
MAASSSESTHLFLAPAKSTLALLQRMRDEGQLKLSSSDVHGLNFAVPFSASRQDTTPKRVPNPLFTHSLLYKDVSAIKHILDAHQVEDEAHENIDVECVPIEFDTLAFAWYVVGCYEVLADSSAVIDFLNIQDNNKMYCAEKEFDLPRHDESQHTVIQTRDIVSILLDSFFITRVPPMFTNHLYIHSASRLVKEFNKMTEGRLLAKPTIRYHSGTTPYLRLNYDMFLDQYMKSFMFHYGGVWSVNKGRYV